MPNHLKFVLKDAVCRRAVEKRLAPVTAERDEVENSALLVANKVFGMEEKFYNECGVWVCAIPPFEQKTLEGWGTLALVEKKEWGTRQNEDEYNVQFGFVLSHVPEAAHGAPTFSAG